MKRRTWLWFPLLALLLAGCGNDAAHTRGVYLLLDTSGTYALELDKAEHIINFVLAKLNPGDSFAVACINTGSFTEKDIVAQMTFDGQPSKANLQKRMFRAKIDKFIQGVKPSAYTDITGGILQASEFLHEQGAGHNTILIFSDLKEDLAKGYVRKQIPLRLKGIDVVAINVTKLHSDNVDPLKYMARLAYWKKRVEAGGGHWRVVNDLERLDTLLQN